MKKQLFYVTFLIILGLGNIIVIGSCEDDDGWGYKLNAYDRKDYIIKKYDNYGKTELLKNFPTEDGSRANITVKEGLEFSIEIINVTTVNEYNSTWDKVYAKYIFSNFNSSHNLIERVDYIFFYNVIEVDDFDTIIDNFLYGFRFFTEVNEDKDKWDLWDLDFSENFTNDLEFREEYAIWTTRIKGEGKAEVYRKTVIEWHKGWIVEIYFKMTGESGDTEIEVNIVSTDLDLPSKSLIPGFTSLYTLFALFICLKILQYRKYNKF